MFTARAARWENDSAEFADKPDFNGHVFMFIILVSSMYSVYHYILMLCDPGSPFMVQRIMVLIKINKSEAIANSSVGAGYSGEPSQRWP